MEENEPGNNKSNSEDGTAAENSNKKQIQRKPRNRRPSVADTTSDQPEIWKYYLFSFVIIVALWSSTDFVLQLVGGFGGCVIDVSNWSIIHYVWFWIKSIAYFFGGLAAVGLYFFVLLKNANLGNEESSENEGRWKAWAGVGAALNLWLNTNSRGHASGHAVGGAIFGLAAYGIAAVVFSILKVIAVIMIIWLPFGLMGLAAEKIYCPEKRITTTVDYESMPFDEKSEITSEKIANEKPSFECAKTNNAVEKIICDDANLSTLDRQMASSYELVLDLCARSKGEGCVDAYKKAQLIWLNARNDCSSNSCIEDIYKVRISELEAAHDELMRFANSSGVTTANTTDDSRRSVDEGPVEKSAGQATARSLQPSERESESTIIAPVCEVTKDFSSSITCKDSSILALINRYEILVSVVEKRGELIGGNYAEDQKVKRLLTECNTESCKRDLLYGAIDDFKEEALKENF